MKNRSGQVSVEFMLLIGLVLLIFIPAFILISRAGLDTTEQISGEQVGALVQSVLDEARETYYLGEGSRQRITVEVPQQINSIFLVNTSDTYELAINFSQAGIPSVISGVSEVPLQFRSTNSSTCDPQPTCGVVCDCESLILKGRSGAIDLELMTKVEDDSLYVEIGYR